MKIGIANDHAATEMKQDLVKYLEEKGYEVTNFGTDTNESVDYPDYGEKVAMAVKSGNVDLGIAICGTGVGIGISCNKVDGVRACICSEPYSAMMSRKHNNANVVCFGARVIGIETAKQIVDAFLENDFEGERHERRVNKIKDIESRN